MQSQGALTQHVLGGRSLVFAQTRQRHTIEFARAGCQMVLFIHLSYESDICFCMSTGCFCMSTLVFVCPQDVSEENYNEFFKTTFSEFLDPLAHVHFNVEGTIEFASILYIPGMAPFDQQVSGLGRVRLALIIRLHCMELA